MLAFKGERKVFRTVTRSLGFHGAGGRRRVAFAAGFALAVVIITTASLPGQTASAQGNGPLELVEADDTSKNMGLQRELNGSFRASPLFNYRLKDLGFTHMEIAVLPPRGSSTPVVPARNVTLESVYLYPERFGNNNRGYRYDFSVGQHPDMPAAQQFKLQITLLPATGTANRVFTADVEAFDPTKVKLMNMAISRYGDGAFTAYATFSHDLHDYGSSKFFYQVKGQGRTLPSVGSNFELRITADSAEVVRWPNRDSDWYRYAIPYTKTQESLKADEEYQLDLSFEGAPKWWKHDIKPFDEEGISNVFTGTPRHFSTGHPVVRDGWTAIWAVTAILLAIIGAWIGVTAMVNHHLGQPSVGWQQMVPRLFLAGIASVSSLMWCALILDLSDAISSYVATAMNLTPGDLVRSAMAPLVFVITNVVIPFAIIISKLYIIYIIFVVMVMIQMIIRLAIINVLVVLAPIAMAMWILPQTAGWGRHWLRLFMTAVFQQSIQLLTVAMGIGFLEAYAPLVAGGSPADTIWSLLLSVGFMYLATKVPTLLGNPGIYDSWVQTLYFATGVMGRLGLAIPGMGQMAIGAAGGMGALGQVGAGMLGGGGFMSNLQSFGSQFNPSNWNFASDRDS